ncbi:MAG TPA: glycosyltransferase [Vicinamibacterales bacterium]|nr:glycosyltransferase [Vicinamibacterales bacterium]
MNLGNISVVVPTRNRSALLAMTLRSVLRQQDVELEVIVVDEGSTDDTAAMLSRLGDTRLRVLRHEVPYGVSTARNRGAAAAAGEWLGFVDDDDLWAPDKLAQQVYAAASTGRDWVYTGSVNISDAGDIIYGRSPLPPEQMMVVLPRYNAIPGGGSNVVVHRAAWERVGPFDTRLRNTEDWEMWIRLAKHGPPACVDRPLLAYRVHGTNSSLDIAEIVRGTKLIERLHHTTADWGHIHRWLAESYLRRGQRSAALGQLLRAAVRGQLGSVVTDIGDVLRRRLTRRRGRPSDSTFAGDAWVADAAEWLHGLYGQDDNGPRLPQAGLAAPSTLQR